ncbi:GNAT family N-acetyltransferase [Pararhizobium haloflavum]|uniref:GNAT family N-acetyltransferase n=1 Tax=Pararhizobium haloflavum TaxID=2037914 RepID=UPI0012FFE8F0|nr:GNAT family N-acetyltransferase [Pararhizobium haloflavum]
MIQGQAIERVNHMPHPTAGNGLSATILDAAGIAALDPAAWDRLARGSLVSNPFYGRQYIMAGLDTIDADGGLRALAFTCPDAGLVGLFFFRWIGAGPLAMIRSAGNCYQVNAAPLVAASHAPRVVSAFVDRLCNDPSLLRAWSMPNIDMSSPFAALLSDACRQAGVVLEELRRYERPVLRPMPGGFDRHVETVLSRSRLKDIRRNLRRLGQAGAVRFERARAPELVSRRVEDFLRIEHTGWKGERGTSFLSRDDHAAFARAAFSSGSTPEGAAVIDSLLLDEVPIAVSINIVDGQNVVTPKCAYDERYRKYGPGMLLEYLVIEAFHQEERWTLMDSATTIDDHVIGGFWNDTVPMADIALAPDTLFGRSALAANRAGLLAQSIAVSMRNKLRQQGMPI